MILNYTIIKNSKIDQQIPIEKITKERPTLRCMEQIEPDIAILKTKSAK